MFIDNAEARKWLLKHGIFLYKDKTEKMSVVAQKHKGDRVKFISNPNDFLDKLKLNIAVYNDSDEFLLTQVVFSDFTAYDKRESEIAEHKQLISDLRKESINFLNIKHAVLCKAPRGKVTVFDLDTGDKRSVDSGVAKGLRTCKHLSSVIETAYKDTGINQYKNAYERATKLWNKVKAVK